MRNEATDVRHRPTHQVFNMGSQASSQTETCGVPPQILWKSHTADARGVQLSHGKATGTKDSCTWLANDVQ